MGRGVCDKQNCAGIIELNTIGAERRREAGARRKQWVVAQAVELAAKRSGFPNSAVEGIRYVDVSELVEGQCIETRNSRPVP